MVLTLTSLHARGEIAYDDAPLPVRVTRPSVRLTFGSHHFTASARRKTDEWRLFARIEAMTKAGKGLDAAIDGGQTLTPRDVFRAREHRWHGDRVCEYELTAVVITPGVVGGVTAQELGGFELKFTSPDGKVAGEYRVARDELEVRQLDERTLRLVVTKARRSEILADLRSRMVRINKLNLSIQVVGPADLPSRSLPLRLDRGQTDRFFYDRGFWGRFGGRWPWARATHYRQLR